MRYLHFNEISIEDYDVIGFDMDGTLYNELFFIKQVYKEIAIYLQKKFNLNESNYIYDWMVNRWIEKGSSYPYIFSEALEKFIGDSNSEIVKKCLGIYRNFKPNVNLLSKVKLALDNLASKNYPLFLVTDGNYQLQKAKYQSLKLTDWFKEEDVVFTGSLGAEYYKPSIKAINDISCLNKNDQHVLYIGDREVDKEFALQSNFDFIMVNNFEQFWEVD